MKIKFSTLAAGLLIGLLCIAPSCSRVDELDNRVTDLEKQLKNLNETQLPSIQDQIQILTDFKTQLESSLPASIQELKDNLAALDGKIDGVDQKYADLIAQLTGQLTETLNGIQGQIDALEASKVNGSDFAAYKEQITETLSTILMIFDRAGLVDFETGTVNDPFKYTDSYIEYVSTIFGGYINGLAADLEALKTKVATDYVTTTFIEQLKEQATAEAKAYAAKIQQDSANFADEINELKAAKIELWNAIDDIINNRITPLEGRVGGLETIIGVLPEDFTTFGEAVSKHQAAIDGLLSRVAALEGKVTDIEELLKHRLQSVVFVPEFRDGALTVNTSFLKADEGKVIPITGDNSIRSINYYQVKPAYLADTLAQLFSDKVLFAAYEAVLTKTRGQLQEDTLKFKVIDLKVKDKDKGIITVTSVVNEPISKANINFNAAALVLRDKQDETGNSRTTEYNLCRGFADTVEFIKTLDPSEDTVIVNKPYNQSSNAYFFATYNSGATTVFQPKFNFGGTAYTAAALKTATGIDVAPYIISKIDFKAGHKSYFNTSSGQVCSNGTTTPSANYFIVGSKPSDYAVINMCSTLSDAAKIVGDTISFFKNFGIAKGTAVGDTLAFADTLVGYFVVDPLRAYANFTATVGWDFEADLKGDRAKAGMDFGCNQLLYKNTNIPVTLVSEDVTTTSGHSIAEFSHQTPAVLTVEKTIAGSTTTLAGSELTNFVCAPKMENNGGAYIFSLDSLAGFNFDASQYVVKGTYALGNPADSIDVTLTITLNDRSRDVISHKFDTVSLTVTKNFGGTLKYALHGTPEMSLDGSYDYFTDIISAYPSGSTSVEDFATMWNWTALGHDMTGGAIKDFVNDQNYILATVPYDATMLYAGIKSFTLKDTVKTGWGQKLALEFPIKVTWPVYDFKAVDAYVTVDDSGNYYSEVVPFYKGQDGNENYNELYAYDVTGIKMEQDFSVVRIDGQDTTVVENLANEGIKVTYSLVPEYGFVTINNNVVSYQDSLAKVGVKGSIEFLVDLPTTGQASFAVPTSFDGNGIYSTFTVHKFDPFKGFGLSGANPMVIVNSQKKYEVAIFEYLSLIDKRDIECIDYEQTNHWVIGDGTNGFASGRSANDAYGIDAVSFSMSNQGIPSDMAGKIHLGTGNDGEKTDCLYFDFDGQQALQKDIVVPVEVTFVNKYSGTKKATVTVTFKKSN